MVPCRHKASVSDENAQVNREEDHNEIATVQKL